MQTELTRLTITEAAALIEARKLSPVELTQAHLDRIAEIDPLLNAFITLTPDIALEAARQAEAEIARGKYRGPLHGVPMAFKDVYETAGVRTTMGAKFLADYIPAQDAFVIERLKAAGVVMLGKLNQHEIALGVTSDNPYYGTCRNPWDTSRIPGGSSGGSAAALAAGLCMGSLGSDSRGSIRTPASLCGVVGLKPTYGAVSTRGVLPLGWSLDHAGPMARTAADTDLLFDVLCAHDPHDPLMVRSGAPVLLDRRDDLRGVTIGVARDAYFRDASDDVLAVVEKAVGLLRQAGADVRDVDFGFLADVRPHSRIIMEAEGAALYAERLATTPEDFSADVRVRLFNGRGYTAVEYANARRVQILATRRLHDFMDAQELDAFILPSTPMTAPRLSDPAEMEAGRASLSRFAAAFNMTGFPALSFPGGRDRHGLPVGVQIVARPFFDKITLQVAQILEKMVVWTYPEHITKRDADDDSDAIAK
ncbi:MAG: amidase [Anaerolineae bacterium]|nr:amidase [Anaerolineae bacterium]